MGLLKKLQHAWNAFINEDSSKSLQYSPNLGYATTSNPYRSTFTKGNERSIITAVYNRIAIDCASIDIKHVRLDENDRFIEDINSNLNKCLTVEANKDQTARTFKQDIIMSLFDEGVVAVVPIDTSMDINKTTSYDILSMRTGRIIAWFPDHVRIEVYNDRKGIKEQITMPKSDVAIIENPLYAIMNEKNSILQRLIRKLNLLDAIDEQSGSGKLDLIVQLPYVIKTEARREQAEKRRKDIEDQLNNSKFGIAYTDGTERITQLNRPVENNLMKQIEYLTSMLYSQLGITQEVLDGSADEKTMLNYMNRTVEPILAEIVNEMYRKFLTKTARSRGESIIFFNNPFRLVPISLLADMADKFTRNEIMSSNEFRQIIGLRPSEDPQADELRNKNLNAGNEQSFANTNDDAKDLLSQLTTKPEGENQNG